MFLNRKQSNKKAAILKAIYYDNLKMAGKCMNDSRPAAKWRACLKPAQTLAVMLVMSLLPFSELDPAVYVNEKLPFPTLSSSAYEMMLPAPDKSRARNGTHQAFSDVASSEGLPDGTTPARDFAAPGDPGLTDYNRLLSGKDKIRLSSLFGLGVKTIVIDPGHGGRDPGAIGAMGTMEKDITLDVAMKLKKRLIDLGRFHVLLTRVNDKTLSLADRVKFAKRNNADLFISVHVNSLPNDRVNVIETYYFGAPMNSETIRLAEQENKESHFSVGELDAIIQDFGNKLKRQESAKLATAIQASLFKNLKYEDTQVLNFGIKMAPFVVLSQIEVPSVLVEISCITKIEEEKKLASSKYRSKIASYVEEGIVAYLETQDFKLSRGENQ